MKKFAYTLAEVLIAMAIIGIITAITLPLANKFMPDGNKALYLNTYDSLVKATHSLASDTYAYPLSPAPEVVSTRGLGAKSIKTTSIVSRYDTEKRIYYKNYPLANTLYYLDPIPYEAGGITKYCLMLAKAYNDNNPACDDTTYTTPLSLVGHPFPNPYGNSFDWAPSFTAKNGVEFMVLSGRTVINLGVINGVLISNNPQISYLSKVYIDIDGEGKGKNCFYDANSCPKPDRFVFEVAPDGKVIASDIKGQEYIKTRLNLRSYKDDDVRNTLNLAEAHLANNETTYPIDLVPEDSIPVGGSDDDTTEEEEEDKEEENFEIEFIPKVPGEMIQQCPVCGQTFNDPIGFKDHIQSHNLNPYDQQFLNKSQGLLNR